MNKNIRIFRYRLFLLNFPPLFQQFGLKKGWEIVSTFFFVNFHFKTVLLYLHNLNIKLKRLLFLLIFLLQKVKSSQLYHDKALFNSVTCGLNNTRNSNNAGTSSSANNCLTPPVHQACASLMDEIVTLWRIACLNPLLNDHEEKETFREQLTQWHQGVVERLRKFCTQILNNNTNANSNIWSSVSATTASNLASANNIEKLLKRLDMDLFSGFLPAVSACEMNWQDFDFDTPALFKQHAMRLLPSATVAPQSAAEISALATNVAENKSPETAMPTPPDLGNVK